MYSKTVEKLTFCGYTLQTNYLATVCHGTTLMTTRSQMYINVVELTYYCYTNRSS